MEVMEELLKEELLGSEGISRPRGSFFTLFPLYLFFSEAG